MDNNGRGAICLNLPIGIRTVRRGRGSIGAAKVITADEAQIQADYGGVIQNRIGFPSDIGRSEEPKDDVHIGRAETRT